MSAPNEFPAAGSAVLQDVPARLGPPDRQGLYDPRNEHDACGQGFVVNIKGHKSHRVLEQAIQVLKNLDHRGACGCEVNTGDGAGVLLQMPHAFNEDVCRKARIPLPGPGQYGSGIIFLPRNPTVRRQVEQRFEQVVQSEGMAVLGWRTVPTSNGMLGETARSCEPFMRQVFIARGADIATTCRSSASCTWCASAPTATSAPRRCPAPSTGTS
jgi:glutamate synthase (ferredoxin)